MIPAFVGVMSTRLGGVFRVDINFSLQRQKLILKWLKWRVDGILSQERKDRP